MGEGILEEVAYFAAFGDSPQFDHDYIIFDMSSLRYGQIIRIRALDKPNTFLTSKSYTDPNLYFQIYNKEDLLPPAGSDVININNYREALFEVLPKGSFEINDQMNSQKDQLKKAQSAPRAKTEEDQFKAIVNEKRGQIIHFGDKVIFRHFDSQHYIYGSYDCATSGIGAFRIDLRRQLSQKIIFELRAHRTYEKQGDKISLSAPFRIYHSETQCYLSYCFEQLFLDRAVQQKINYGDLGRSDPGFPIDPPKIKTTVKEKDEEELQMGKQSRAESGQMLKAGRYLIINENIPKRVFKLVPHNEFEMKINRQAIKNHDIVYFIHTENEQYICPDNFSTQIYLKKRIGDSDLIDIFDGLWEIQEVKTIEKKTEDLNPNVSLNKSRTPIKKDPIKEISKKFGHLLSAGATGGDLNATYLLRTVGNPMEEGQYGAGLTTSATDNDQQQKGGKKKEKYLLRHLASGRIMFVRDLNIELEQNYKVSRRPLLLLESIDNKLEDNSLVQFTFKRRQGQKFVKKYLSTIKDKEREDLLKSPTAGLGAIEEGQEEAQQESYIEEDHEDDDILYQAFNSKFMKTKLSMVDQSAQHGFRIYKVSEEVKQLCLFVLSSQQLIFKFIGLLNQYETVDELLRELTVFLLNNVINVLKSLIGFIYDTDYNKIAQSGNNPNAKKQRILDEVGMIELITRLLEVIHKRDFEKGEYLHVLDEQNHKSEYRKIRTVYELGYKLLESNAAGNTLKKLKISRYLNRKYLHQILQPRNRTVYRSIQQVLEGNLLALEQIKEPYIGELIARLNPDDPDPADLYFLSRLCLCGQKKVHKNQVKVFKSFYEQEVDMDSPDDRFSGKEEETLPPNKFKFREDQQKMQILSRITPGSSAQYRTLSELYEECQLMKSEGGYNPDKNHWAYFMMYLNLLADLCVQRNTVPLPYINRNLPLKTLVAFLHETTVKKNLLFQPFIRLVHHAFVETSDYQDISRITKVKDWYGLGNFAIPKAKKQPIPSDIQKTMTLIFDYIRRINRLPFQHKRQAMNAEEQAQGGAQPETIDLDIDDKDRLTNVKTFLEILKSTLNLGFWPRIEQMKKMVPYLLKVMRFDIEYCDKELKRELQALEKGGGLMRPQIQIRSQVYSRIKKQLKLNKPNIVLLVECKVLAAKILNIIIDYEYNVRVSIITKHFKDVMEVDTDLSAYTYNKKEFIDKWYLHNQYQLFMPTNKKEGYLLNQQLWMDKVEQILNSRDLFEECVAENIHPKLTFFEAFIYSNQELTNLTLELIDRVTHQRADILRTFKDIIFVSGGVLQELAEKGVKSTRSMLLNLAKPTIKQDIPDNKLILSLKPPKGAKHKDGVIQQLAQLTMSMMKKGDPVLDIANFYKPENLFPFHQVDDYQGDISERARDFMIDKTVNRDGSFLIITEKDRNLTLDQNLIKSQDHHLIIVDFLEVMNPLPSTYELAVRALNAAYNFLTVLVWNNIDNKKELQFILKVAEPHLKQNVGCIDFFKQMYTNNKKLVKSKDIASIIEQVIEYANDLSLNKFQKSKLLDFLRIAVIFDDKGYDINQNMVMEIISQYQVSSNNRIVYLAQQQKNEGTLSAQIARNRKDWFNNYLQRYEDSCTKYIDLDVSPELFYMATFFQIFSALIQNENVVNIGKAGNMHPIEFLLNLLEEAGPCWMVVRHLRSYLNKLYYFENRKKDSVLRKAFTEIDLHIIKEELFSMAKLVCNTPDYHMIRIKNAVRYSYMSSYVYLSLEEILHSLDLLTDQAKDRQYWKELSLLIAQPDQHSDLIFTILEIIEYLQYLLKTIPGRYINKYISKVSKRMKQFIKNIPLKFTEMYINQSKTKTLKNIQDNDLSSDQIPSKKSYTFHDGKTFWRHLLDWDTFKTFDSEREKNFNNIQKKVEPLPNEPTENLNNRKRDYNIELICYANIDKRIQTKIQRFPSADKQQKHDDTINKKQQSSLPKNLTTSESNRFDVKKEKFKSADDQNIVINLRRKKLVKFIEINEAFHLFSDQEIHEQLYDVFADLRCISANRYHFDVNDQLEIVDRQEVIKSIVKMNELDSNSIKPQYKLLTIRLLTNYIQRTSSIFSQEIQKWTVHDTQKEKINQAQKFLHGCGVASFLSSLIINDLKYSIQMRNAILMLGISLLMGRSSDMQRELFDLIKKDDNNLFMIQMNTLVKECGASISAHLVGSQPKEYNKRAINYSDTYDYYDDKEKIVQREFVYQPETVMEQKEFEQKVLNMKYAFILLRNLCEGNIQIKKYVHVQTLEEEENKPKAESVDLLALAISELKRMFGNFDIDIIKVPFAIIDFIYQVTQIPCLFNQEFICQSSLFQDFADLGPQINKIVEKSDKYTLNKNLVNIFQLYSSNIRTVISCLQGNVPKIYSALSTDKLCEYFVRMVKFYLQHLPTVQNIDSINSSKDLEMLLSKNKLHENYYLDLLQIATVIVKLNNKTPVKEFHLWLVDYMNLNNMTDYIKVLRDNLLGIEIKVDGTYDPYQTLFFPKHNVFKYLSRTTRTYIMETVNRSTQRDKIIGLTTEKEPITKQIQYSYYLDNQYRLFNVPLSITTQRIETAMNWGMTLASLICLLMLYFATVVYYPYTQEIQYDLGREQWLLNIMSFLQFSIAMTYFFLWVNSHVSLAIQKYQRNKRAAAEEGEQLESKWMSMVLKIPGCKQIYCITDDGQFGTMLLFMFGSLMGMFYKIQWYSLLLMNLMMAKLDVLTSIVRALKVSVKMLGILAFFGVSFITFFSVFSLGSYAESIYPDRYPDTHCQTVFDCVIELYIKEQIGEDMEEFKGSRFTYDMIYVVFMDMLFGNILGGVLIDNFASLRQERQDMLQDKTEKCFICGIDKEALEKKSLDLKTHYIRQNHKLWNYVFYLYYLDKQSKKTGLEEQIQQKVAVEDVSWIPVATAEEQNLGDLLSKLEELINEQKQAIENVASKQE